MRRFLFLCAAAMVVMASATAVMAETTKTLRIEYAPTSGERFKIENLAGTMKVVAGGGDKVVAVATLHAEDDQLAAMVDFVKVEGPMGEKILRVQYPVDEYRTFRYPGRSAESSSSSFLGLFGGSSSTADYDGHRVKVSSSSGVLLYADVEVRLPRGEVEGTFRNVVGSIRAEDVGGRLTFDTGSGNIDLARLEGRIGADTGSGDINASSIEGSFSGDTGSGDIMLERFRGEEISCDTGSGDVEVRSSTARRVSADTGSGSISVTESDVEEVNADTGSGSITLEATGNRLMAVLADTGSGDVTIRLDPQATFEAMADQGSGRIHNGFEDARPIVHDREVVGYRRGDARIRIKVETGSGDLTLEPLH